ncbi:MAG: protein-L-isoaspartate(D-aspartate) O-methyltransferase [Kiloniellales bacterium]
MSEFVEPDFDALRQAMVEVIATYAQMSAEQTQRDRFDQRVMTAISGVPRHAYVPEELQPVAYANIPLPIGHGKTISQPFIVALMTDLLDLDHGDRVLEVGTGLGYQAAILAELAGAVYSVEILEELGRDGEQRLHEAGYDNVQVRIGNGAQGWQDSAPFDKIIVTAAPELIPTTLIEQLRPGGRMVIPAGLEQQQQLMLIEKDPDGHLESTEILPVLFSRMITAH